MASIAFAAVDISTGLDSSTVSGTTSITNTDPVNDTLVGTTDGRLYPGESYKATVEEWGADPAKTVKSITTKWSKGGALVASMKLKDSKANIELALNENYTISDPKDLEGTLTIKYTDGSEDEITIVATVGNELAEIDGYSKKADAKDDAIDAQNNTIYKCTDAGYLAFNSDTRLLTTVLKMAKDEKAFMYSNEDMIDDVEDKYGDLDAEINCYQFGGRPTFRNAAEFTLQADYADQYYVYEWDGKKLTKQDYTWNSIDGVYEWSTKSPKAYVISDKELVAADEDEEDAADDSKNPDTGANDVVGVAAALAVVSLVAAGAVSLKK